jgi:hypothetical protein
MTGKCPSDKQSGGPAHKKKATDLRLKRKAIKKSENGQTPNSLSQELTGTYTNIDIYTVDHKYTQFSLGLGLLEYKYCISQWMSIGRKLHLN